MKTPSLVPVRMVREDLKDLPQFRLPAPFTIRRHRPGDAETWLRIQRAAERYLAIDGRVFEDSFGHDPALLAQRQLFLCDQGGNEIGTVTAWFDSDFQGAPYGRLHWLALVPEWQGRGLGKPLVMAACHRLAELGHLRAYLATATVRTAAIALYLKVGFRPDIRDDADRQAWRQVKARIPGLSIDLP